ncbi:MAG TPA: lysophospholipid acyltransferase family protein, partial [Chloroflexota bacterium]|nr:lysophospholipid acyltransferase family protein [Chloroflexota bacterium]
LLTWRRLGPYLRDAGHIAVCPEEGLRSYRHLVRAAREVLTPRESLVIFPQGGILGIEAEFVRGAFALARTLQRPLLPVALTGSHRVWEYPYTPRLRYGERITLRVFPPISAEEVASRDVDDLRLEVQRLLKTAALSGTMAPPRRFVPARDGYWDGYAYRIDPTFADLAADIDRHRRQRTKEEIRTGIAGEKAAVGGQNRG